MILTELVALSNIIQFFSIRHLLLSKLSNPQFSSFQHDMMERDRMIEQIKSDISHRDLVLEDQTKQLRYELSRNCSLCNPSKCGL